MSHIPPVSPIAAGLGGKCPRCGQGALFKSFLGLKERCDACGLDYSKADSGDGPVVIILFIVGFVGVTLVAITRYVFFASILASFLISAGVATLLSLALLRPLKATLVALQYRYRGERGQLEE